MRNILVLVHEDEGQESRLQAALSVTRGVGGHLTALDVFVIPMIVADPWSGYADATMVRTASEADATHCSRIEQRLAREDVPWSVAKVTGEPAEELRLAAELADLIVVSSHGSKQSIVAERAIVGDLAIKSGRPILAVPPECVSFDPTGRALVAWDGSHAANQALRAATPLLALAEGVTVMVVNESDGPFSSKEAASYLSRHGIEPRILERTTSGSIAGEIIEQTRNEEASYIVMGAFGRGRAVEALFGGVTRSVLAGSPVPLLLAH
ncbi:universal stress protein A [Tsuneonella deserti]|uniref:Universal stress protein A n=1 Tax=Tsuneonella deserti TaxID=2035528 RepID=A0ABQ1SBR3_9SPHN|nr:universal stress protein [Tsuneonella deserti]GGD99488.1 universal stress protein A [Tsuneonella deserti]